MMIGESILMKTSCGIFIFNKDKKFLACKQSGPYAGWTIPKGHNETDESFLLTAIRECKEESNIDITKYTTNIEFVGFQVYKHKKKKIAAFIAFVDEIIDEIVCHPINGKVEIDGFEWMTIDEGLEKIHYTQQELLKIIREKYALKNPIE